MNREECIYRIDLTRKGDPCKLRVDMEAFFAFSFWIAKDLADLVAKYEKENGDRLPGLQNRTQS